MKRVAILGSSGSVGRTTLEVIRSHRREFKLESLAVNKNIALLKQQIEEFNPRKVVVVDERARNLLRGKIGKGRVVWAAQEGLERIALDKEADIVVIALSGSAALFPLLAAIKAGKHIALANKESLVMAGAVVMDRLKKSKAKIIPVDSEQSAIFQCLRGEERNEINKLYLTASGGPLYDVPFRRFKYLKEREIMKHPRWRMGRKITVDSATLMNKGLEVIEARWLFDVDVKNIEVLIHREAIIHSMVEFVDGVVLAQLGITDMTLPIQYALGYPRRMTNKQCRLDFLKLKNLSFDKPDTGRFPCLGFAFEAAKIEGSAPCVLNAVNEEAVNAFLDKRISFIAIPKIIEKVMSGHKVTPNPDLNEILQIDSWARQQARALIYNRR